MNEDDDFLEHEGRDYYDPVKAREYYLRTRELKGRRKSSDIKGDDKKQQWANSQKFLNAGKKKELTNEATKYKENVNKVKFLVAVRQKQLSAQIKQILEKVAEDAKKEREQLTKERDVKLEKLAADVKKKLESLPPIPNGVGEEKAAELRRERTEQILSIKNDAAKERGQINKDFTDSSAKSAKTSGDKQKFVQAYATKQQQEVANQLKTSIQQAKNRYLAVRDRVAGNYELKLQSIYNSITTGK
jgi:hypothetical protein